MITRPIGMRRRLALAILLCAVAAAAAAWAQPDRSPFPFRHAPGLNPADEEEPLPPDEAFKVTVGVDGPRTIVARFVPADGYYLYRDKFAFDVEEPADVRVTGVELPRGEIKDDPFLGKTEILHTEVRAVVRLNRARAGPVVLRVAYQGCNIRLGVCYLLIKKQFRLELPAPGNLR